MSLIVGLHVGQKPLTTTVQTEVINAANSVVYRDSQNVLVGADEGRTGTEFRLDLPLATLTSGQHLARITIRAGKTTLTRNLVFTIQ